MLLKSISLSLVFISSSLAQKIVDLSGKHWTLTDQQGNVSIPGAVPSNAYLDLFAAKVIPDPLYGTNEINTAWVAFTNWTYISAPISGLSPGVPTYLVFDGIDTIASITFCNQSVGVVDNQFRQWTFDVSSILSSCFSSPVLSLSFTSPVDVANYLENPSNPELSCPTCFEIAFVYTGREFIRKQQIDFGWNWAPAYAPTGIWQPAYVVQLESKVLPEIYVSNSMVDIYRRGQLNNLSPDQTQRWVVNVSIDYLGTLPPNSRLVASIPGFLSGPLSGVNVRNGTITGSGLVKGSPKLWWPVGYGSQTLYNMQIEIFPANSIIPIAFVTKRVGFRTIVLNQGLITTDQESLGIAPGANWHFEINGHEIFVKGSSVVPPEVFWPSVTESEFRLLFETVVAGNQNMLRVWGGGSYLPDYAYDLADEMGILIWAEMAYSDAIYPITTNFLENAIAEAYYQIRRVNHHPSLALWSGNNEIEFGLDIIGAIDPPLVAVSEALYSELFLNVLIHSVFDNSRSISYLPSSITNGYLSLNHSAEMPIIERYNNLSAGSVFGNSDYYNYDVTQVFNLSTYPIGRFATEFGFHSHSNVLSYAGVMPQSELSFNSSTIVYRNREYPLNYSTFFSSYSDPPAAENLTAQSLGGLGQMSQGITYWYPSNSTASPATIFDLQVFATQIFQSEVYRSQIAFYRRGSGMPERTLGSLYWVLNEIWSAPCKASVGHDGRWKGLHYGARDIYEPVVIAPYYDQPSGAVEVWATSDLWNTVQGTASIAWYDWSGKSLTNRTADHQAPITIGAVNSTQFWSFDANTLPFNSTNAVAFLTINATVNGVRYSHINRFTPLPLSNPLVISAIQNPLLTFRSVGNVFTVQSQAVAIFVWLEHPAGVRGYWSDNGFWMLPGKRQVTFTVQVDTTGGKWTKSVAIKSLYSLISP
ncbi:glycoside hydrolase family 2 protein [Athelia psychrophila]|uniref:Beta-mannosidase A n=1 Tax=Athelia psychrophila TaxID=1759441 RepID=A0A166CPC4_9AGAM|nr:glycoside hydrolase family 2 protein [Fibularhizoctonia sp. CBS 109695]